MLKEYNIMALKQAIYNLLINVKTFEPYEKNLTYTLKLHLLIIYNMISFINERIDCIRKKIIKKWLYFIKTNRKSLLREAIKDLDRINLYIFQRAIIVIRPLP
jgi:hypothetical protein